MRKIPVILTIFLTLLLLWGCRTSQQQQQDVKINGKGFGIEYAELLVMEELDHGRTLCRILDPWRTGRVMMQYLLVPKNDAGWTSEAEEAMLTKYGDAMVVRTPLERMTITTSCHTWLLSQLDALGSIAILCDTVFINASNI